MTGIWVFNLSKWKPFIFICVASLFVASWLFVQRDNMSVFSTSDGPQAFYRAETSTDNIALTFNISWGEQNVTPTLQVLQDHEVRNATFFLSASWAEKYPDLVKEIVDAGYTIGSHGYRYKNYSTWSDEQVVQDMRRSKHVLQELTGETPTLLRPPNGAFTAKTLDLAQNQHLDIIHWSVNSFDYENPGAEKIVENVLANTTGGDVLMFHASDSVKQTNTALPVIIKTLKERNYTFTSLEELMSSAHSNSEEVN